MCFRHFIKLINMSFCKPALRDGFEENFYNTSAVIFLATF
jgi:hypothetical protein